MLLKTARLVNLLLAGTLAGNEFGTWAAVHPALEELSPAERLRAEQALTRRFGAIMPAWMGAALPRPSRRPCSRAGRQGSAPRFSGPCASRRCSRAPG